MSKNETETVWKPHVTVSAVVQHQDRFLLVEERVGGRVQYNNPAGHLEEGESLTAAVRREVREEAARDFHPEVITGIYLWRNADSGKTFLRVSFAGGVSNHDPEQDLDDGILRTLWATRDEIASGDLEMRSPLVLQSIDDHLAQRHYPLEMLNHLPDGDF